MGLSVGEKREEAREEEGWVIVDPIKQVPLELFPPRQGEDGYGEVKLVNSTQELDESKTWVIVQRDGESDALAWSPCDGQRFMVPYAVAAEGEGLLLAPGSCHDLQEGTVLVDYEEEAVYVCAPHEYHLDKFWIYSSLTDQWEFLDCSHEQPQYVFDEEEGTDLGKLYLNAADYNPKLKVIKRFPALAPGMDNQFGGLHWYKGVLYGIGITEYDRSLTLFKWGAWWEQVDSCPAYQQGERLFSGDIFRSSGGSRYICITQGNISFLGMLGRFMVVYDLEENKWHYHTLQMDELHGWTTALVCTRGSHKKRILDSVYKSVWSQGSLPLPHVPSRT